MTEFIHPYQGAYDLDWTDDYNGNLTAAEVEQRKAQWVGWVDTCHPLTMAIYKQMAVKQKRGYRRAAAWASAGGLKLVSRGKSIKAFRAIRNRWKTLAENRAYLARTEAGWTGRYSLTSPTGLRTGPNDQPFGRFTLPGDEFDSGMWDGVLKSNLRFTI